MSTRIGEPKSIDLTGKLSPFRHNNQPVWLCLTSEEQDRFIVLFDDLDKLNEALTHVENVGEYKVVKVDEGFEFLDSIPLTLGDHNLRIALNPHFTPPNRWRWTEVLRERH